MIRRTLPQTCALVAATIVLGCTAGGAFAFWTGAGHGTAEVRIGNPKPLTLSLGAPSATLYPGGDASVAVLATNPNPYAVHIGSLTLDPTAGTGGFGVDPAHAGCDVAALSFTAHDGNGAGWSVPPRTGSTDGSLAISLGDVLTMSMDAANACQGATFTVHLEAGR